MTTKTKTSKTKKATKRAVAKAIKAAPKNPALDKALVPHDTRKAGHKLATRERKRADNTTADGRTHASTVENPCQLVWDLADKMVPKGATRKEVMVVAMRLGVAFYTARTQYQLWSQASRASK